jgi:hypothetical protein
MLIGRGWTVEAWVDSLGVLEEFRGRGIGGALLDRALRGFRDSGYKQVALNVDSANPTGATRLYEAHGMHVRRHWVVFNKPLADSMPVGEEGSIEVPGPGRRRREESWAGEG